MSIAETSLATLTAKTVPIDFSYTRGYSGFMTTKTPERIAVTPDTKRKAKLLAVLLDIEINEAVDIALSEKLLEVQQTQAKPPTKKK